MNNNYNNQQNYPDDHGRRYRDQGGNAPRYYDSHDNYDVVTPSRIPPQSPQSPQNYDQQQYYNNMPIRQNPRDYYGGPVQQQSYHRDPRGYYDDQAYAPNRGYYDPGRYDAYGDSYTQYDNRYDDRDRRNYYDGYNDYDKRSAKPAKKKAGAVAVTIRVIAIIVLLVGLGIVGFKLYGYYTEGKGHRELQALSADFNQLYERNNDFFGWLKLEDSVIDYPVMYSPDEPERYLHMNFDGDYSESGELFMDAECDPNGYHYLIYGHHMHNESMLGSLPKFEDTDYLNSHRTFRFDTRSEKGEYEIFAVFYSQVYGENDDVFKYYDHANLNAEDEYNNFIANVKAMSLYDTGVTPVYGEKIVTLSTCNYHTEDGRFVVCGRKIS